MQRTNVAARAGRWSSQHRRAAILGWLAFVVMAVFVGGAVGTKHIPQDNNGVGESGRAQQILHDEFPQPANEQVLIQSAALTVRDPALPSRRFEDVTRRLSATGHGPERALAAGWPATRAKSPRRPLGAGRLPDHAATRPTRTSASHASLAATAAAQRAHPDLRIEQAGDASADKGAEQELQRRLRQGADALAADHAADPGGRVRRPGGGRHPGAARRSPASRRRSAWSPSSARSPPSTRSVSEMVLLIGMAVGVDYSLFYMRREREERAAGQGRAGRPGGRRGDLGPRRPGLGLTVMAAMAGHVPGRQQDVRLDGDRHDHGRRGRGARLADRAARAAVQARRQGDEGPRAVRRAPPGARRRGADVERDRRPRAAPPAGRRCLSPAGLSSRWRSPRSGCTPRYPGSRACPQGCRSSRRSTASRPRSRAGRCRPTWSSKADDVTRPQVQDGDRQPRTEGAGHRADPSAVQRAGQPTDHDGRRSCRCR